MSSPALKRRCWSICQAAATNSAVQNPFATTKYPMTMTSVTLKTRRSGSTVIAPRRLCQRSRQGGPALVGHVRRVPIGAYERPAEVKTTGGPEPAQRQGRLPAHIPRRIVQLSGEAGSQCPRADHGQAVGGRDPHRLARIVKEPEQSLLCPARTPRGPDHRRHAALARGAVRRRYRPLL